MADEIRFEDYYGNEITQSGDVQSLPQLYGLVKNVPSATQDVRLRNESDDKFFRGVVRAMPVEGRSYASDVQVAQGADTETAGTTGATGEWSSEVGVLIAPEEIAVIHVRVVPRLTPEDSSGRAALTVDGDFIT